MYVILLLSNPSQFLMDQSELIELIEGPILKAYYSSVNDKTGKRKFKDSKDSKSDIKTVEIAEDTTTSSGSGSFGATTAVDSHVNLSESQRDRRTVFVQQLSVRCTDSDLYDFFTENGCPVRHARIVLDKYTRRSKGVAYIEFFEEDTVRAALKLSGKKLIGVPVIVELTETEKNRIAQEAAILNASAAAGKASNASSSTATIIPADDLVRLYVGSLHPSLTELELEQLFEPFGVLESVELLKDERGGSKGVAFIQYVTVGGARNALEALNGFELAGRAIRVGPVRIDKSKQSITATSKSSTSKPPPVLPSQQQQQQNKINAIEVDEEENITIDSKKRAELMQKLLLSTRK